MLYGFSLVHDIRLRLSLGQNPVQALIGALRTLVKLFDGSDVGGPY